MPIGGKEGRHAQRPLGGLFQLDEWTRRPSQTEEEDQEVGFFLQKWEVLKVLNRAARWRVGWEGSN